MYQRQRISRRTFLRGSAAGAGVVGLASVVGLEACSNTHASPATPTVPASPSATPVAYRGLHSRPDLNGAPAPRIRIDVEGAGRLHLPDPAGRSAEGAGDLPNSRGPPLFWFQPSKGSDAANLQVTTYKGLPTLAWFEGDVNKAGTARAVISSTTTSTSRWHASGRQRGPRRPARSRDYASGHRTHRRLYAEDRRPTIWR